MAASDNSGQESTTPRRLSSPSTTTQQTKGKEHPGIMAASDNSGQESTTPRRLSSPSTTTQQTKGKEAWSQIYNELTSMTTRIDKVEHQLNDIREHRSSQTDGEESARTRVALKNSQDDVDLIKGKLNEAITNLGKREAVLKQREEELQATQRQVDNLTKQRADDQKELSHFKNLVEELKKQLTERENKIKDLERELKKTRYDLDVTRKDLKDTNKNLKSSQEELKATKKDLKSIKEEVKVTRDELKRTKALTRDELKRTNAELSSMKDVVNKLAEDMHGIKHAACSEDLAEEARGTQQQDSLPLRQQHRQQPAQLQPSLSQSIGADRAVSNQSLSLPPIRYNFPPPP